jgi:hypothetical protein
LGQGQLLVVVVLMTHELWQLKDIDGVRKEERVFKKKKKKEERDKEIIKEAQVNVRRRVM